MKRKILSFFAVGFFSLIAIFHFLRLTFGWDIIVGKWIVPTWFSGALILFAIFMVFSTIKSKRKVKNELPEGETPENE